MNSCDISKLVELCDVSADAYHTLLEVDDDIVPLLMQHYATITNGDHRACLVEVIWQHRLSTTIPFLAAALHDEYPEVWKQALDGLVTIGQNESRKALEDCLTRLAPDDNRAPWIAEALDQISLQLELQE